MPHSIRFRSFVLSLTALTAIALFPVRAEAQWHGPYHRGPRVVVGFGFGLGFGYPYYPFYSPWYPYGYGFGYPAFGFGYPWYGGYPPYGYGYYGYPAFDPNTSSLRLDVAQRNAQVFVDGYAAGVVDDYDGVFQRLRMRPGPHEVTVFLNGFRTIRRSIYFGPGTDQKIRETMAPLGPGETSEAPPAPSAPPEPTEPDPAREPRAPQEQRPGREIEVARASFGTVTIRVQPADALIYVDGEQWSTPAEQERLSIRLAEGRHRIEVKKEGFVTYAEDVLVRRNATLTLNVSLLRGR